MPLREYGKEHHRKLPSLPQIPPLCSSASRLLMGWWDREVNIWQVSESSTNGGAYTSEQNKLVGKVLLQDEEHLSSATMSQDGKLLVAATISQVKLFSLRLQYDGSVSLRVNKIDLPSEISSHGAKLVSVSPDCQWLFIVRPNNDLYASKIVRGTEDDTALPTLSKPQKLRRVSRNTRAGKIMHGTLGSYDRTIRCITFSSDSTIVACGDLSGCIDTWILRNSDSIEDKDSDSSDEDSSEDEDEEEKSGEQRSRQQRWFRTSSETPIPRLNSAILLMSFRPTKPTTPKLLTNGTPSAKTSTQPVNSTDDRLMVLNADHHLTEFEARNGRLSDWSRKNPKSYLPKEFTVIKDRAMGLIWDVSDGRERLWAYGPSWLWMFDLSQDFPPPPAAGDKETTKSITEEPHKLSTPQKRKRRSDDDGDINDNAEKKRKPNSGAGDTMPLSETNIGLAQKMRKTVGNDGSEGKWIELDSRQARKDNDADADADDGEGDDYDAEEDDPSDARLAALRRQEGSNHKHINHDPTNFSNGMSSPPSSFKRNANFAVVIRNRKGATQAKNDSKQASPEPDSEPNTQSTRRWWFTFKYREILGVVPLSQGSGSSPEVAVVERPIWDVNLPGRYIRDYE